MSYDLGAFAAALMGDPVLALIVVLTLGATVVNGATDAPNAIATVVGTKAMRPGPAIAMAAVCNFVGLAAITMVSSAVALTIFKMVDFGGDNQAALIALAAAMVAIIVWGVTAWYFGIPTSQSHSLIAGITGAAIALQGGLTGVNGDEWVKVVYGLVISTFLGFGTGWLFTRLIKKLCCRASRAKANSFFKWAQIISGAGVAVLHGAQDGQKFMSLCMLGIMIGMSGAVDANVEFPFWLIILVSATMALGTAVGGKKIIKSVVPGLRCVPVGLLLHRSGHLYRHARVHHAHEDHRHHGRWRREEHPHGEVGSGRQDGAHLGAYLPRLRSAGLRVHAPVSDVHVGVRSGGALVCRPEMLRPPDRGSLSCVSPLPPLRLRARSS